MVFLLLLLVLLLFILSWDFGCGPPVHSFAVGYFHGGISCCSSEFFTFRCRDLRVWGGSNIVSGLLFSYVFSQDLSFSRTLPFIL